jgi:hypothetical protein
MSRVWREVKDSHGVMIRVWREAKDSHGIMISYEYEQVPSCNVKKFGREISREETKWTDV